MAAGASGVDMTRRSMSESFYGCDLWAEDLHRVDEVPPELIDDTVAGYQAAYLLFTKGLLKEDVVRNGVPEDAGLVE